MVVCKLFIHLREAGRTTSPCTIAVRVSICQCMQFVTLPCVISTCYSTLIHLSFSCRSKLTVGNFCETDGIRTHVLQPMKAGVLPLNYCLNANHIHEFRVSVTSHSCTSRPEVVALVGFEPHKFNQSPTKATSRCAWSDLPVVAVNAILKRLTRNGIKPYI